VPCFAGPGQGLQLQSCQSAVAPAGCDRTSTGTRWGPNATGGSSNPG